MRSAKRWLLWKAKPKKSGKPAKVPYYVNGNPRCKTDSPEDVAQFAEFDQAVAVLLANPSKYAGLGFALGPDGTGYSWQGVDLDDFAKHPHLQKLSLELPGYTELSPSLNGAKCFGYGPVYANLASNDTGIEAYAGRRFFTVTGFAISNSDTPQPVSLVEFVRSILAPLYGGPSYSGSVGPEPPSAPIEVSNELFSDLNSALDAMPSDDRGEWIAIGQALCGLGDVGFVLWAIWSAKSAKYNQEDLSIWETFKGERTSYRAVFRRAERHGWVNPRRSRLPELDPTKMGFGLAALPQGAIPIDPIPFENLPLSGHWRFELYDPVVDASLPPVTYRDDRNLWPDSPGKTVTQIIADPKCHKTNWIMAEAFQLVLTGKARVLMLSLEGGYGVRSMRLKALADHHAIAPAELRGRFQVVKIVEGGIFDLSDPSCVQAFIAFIRDGGWTDVVIDTQHRAAGSLDENSATDARKLWNAVERIRSLGGVNVTLVHHKGKDGAKGGRGSSADLASVDQQIELSFERTAMIVTARVTARKDGIDGFSVPSKVYLSAEKSVPILIPITSAEFETMSERTDVLREHRVVSALRNLGCIGEKSCSSKELSVGILKEGGREEIGTPSTAEIARLADQLTKGAPKRPWLTKYRRKSGNLRQASWRWALPAPIPPN